MNMRTEKEMFDLILDFARQDDRIRLVAMNGSRANPNAQPDKYQDFDIVYLVTDMQSFLSNDAWLNTFGNRIIMQKPDTMQPDPSKRGSAFAYLMQFEDGNRIDLTLFPVEELETYLESDRMCVLLLDKDGLVPNLPHSTDQHYWVRSHPTRPLMIAATNFGGSAPMLPKVWRGVRSPMPMPTWT
jgi:aminoglycoside 6-adenylyltransferase